MNNVQLLIEYNHIQQKILQTQREYLDLNDPKNNIYEIKRIVDNVRNIKVTMLQFKSLHVVDSIKRYMDRDLISLTNFIILLEAVIADFEATETDGADITMWKITPPKATPSLTTLLENNNKIDFINNYPLFDDNHLDENYFRTDEDEPNFDEKTTTIFKSKMATS